MKFQPFFEKEKKLGFVYESGSFDFLFGNRFCDLTHLKEKYRNVREFRFLRQVHGDRVVHASSQNSSLLFSLETDEGDNKNEILKKNKEDSFPSADAHWTEEADLFLCLQTADCLPILVSDQTYVLALHAGWRGLVKNIISKALKAVFSPSSLPFLQVAIGPHIQKEHYEVTEEVGEKMARSYRKHFPYVKDFQPLFFPHEDRKKRYVSLKALAYAQLRHFGCSSNQIFISSEDSFSSLAYESYRREGEKSGRQISGVLKKVFVEKKRRSL